MAMLMLAGWRTLGPRGRTHYYATHYWGSWGRLCPDWHNTNSIVSDTRPRRSECSDTASYSLPREDRTGTPLLSSLSLSLYTIYTVSGAAVHSCFF